MKTSLTKILFAIGSSLCALIAASATATAQPAPVYGPPPTTIVRDGFLIGFSIGGGTMYADNDSLSGFAFDFSIGGMINPTLAIMYDASAVMHPEENAFSDGVYIFTNSHNALALQAWVAPRAWVKGGIGVSRAFVTGNDGDQYELESAFGVTAAVGYELVQSRTSTIDGSLRVGSSFYDNFTLHDASLMVGFHWY